MFNSSTTRNEETQTNGLPTKNSTTSIATGPAADVDEDSGQELLTSAHAPSNHELFLQNTGPYEQPSFSTIGPPAFIPPDPVGPYLQEADSYSRGTGHQAFVDLYSKPKRTEHISNSIEHDSPDYDEVATYQRTVVPKVVVSNYSKPPGDRSRRARSHSGKQNGAPPQCVIQRTAKPIQRKRKVTQRKTEVKPVDSGSDDSYMCPVTLIHGSRLATNHKTRPHSLSDSELSSHIGSDGDDPARTKSIASMSCLSEVTMTPENTSDIPMDDSFDEDEAIAKAISHIESISNSISNNITKVVGNNIEYTTSYTDDDDWDKRSAISL